MAKTHWTKYGSPYWTLPLRELVFKGETIKGVAQTYVQFGGKKYRLRVTKAVDKDFPFWLCIESLSYKAGRGYGNKYRSFSRTSKNWSRSPF